MLPKKIEKTRSIGNIFISFRNLTKLLCQRKYFVINISIIIVLGLLLQKWLYYYESYGTSNQIGYIFIFNLYILGGYSFIVGWGINHWWDTYVNQDSYRYPDLKLIKNVSIERIILQCVVLQSFWLIYWLRNPFLLVIIIGIIIIYNYSYSLPYPSRNHKIKSPKSWPFVARMLHGWNDKEIDLLQEPRITTLIAEINKTSSLMHKLRLIHIDFKMVLGSGYGSITLLFFVLAISVQWIGLFTLPYTNPLNNYKAWVFNYIGDLPQLEDSQFYPQTAYKMSRRSSRSGTYLKFELLDNKQNIIHSFTVLDYVELFARDKELSQYETWATYEKHSGVSDFWLSPRHSSLLQMHDEKPYRMEYQSFIDLWKGRRNCALSIFWGIMVLFLLWRVKDYWVYRLFERFYHTYQRDPNSIESLVSSS